MKTPVILSIMMITFMSNFTNNNVIKDSGYQIGDVVSDFELKNYESVKI